MPKRCTEAGLAAVLDVTCTTVAGWRKNQIGPEHVTLVNGSIAYERRHVIPWVAHHMKGITDESPHTAPTDRIDA